MDRNHSLGHSVSRSRRALRATFALVGRPVYHTTLLLLDQETEAAAAVADIYRRISTDELAQYDISTQEQLLRTAVQVEVKARIKALLSRDPHVFDLPKGGPRPQPLQADDHTPASLLQALPTLYRFLFVLSALWDYDRKELKKLFRLDDRSLDQALSALPAMVEGLVRPSSLPWDTYEAWSVSASPPWPDARSGTPSPMPPSSSLSSSWPSWASYTGERLKFTEISSSPRPFGVNWRATTQRKVVFSMSKKKHKKSNPHSAPQPKAKSTQPAKQMNPLVWGIGAIVVVAIVIIAAVVLTQKAPSTTSGAQNSANPTVTTSAETYTPPALEKDVTYTARIDVKDYGTITVELDQSVAPVTCANFVELANSGFYDGLTFHRIEPGFVIQGGDPNGNGTGGSEHDIVGEFAENGYKNDLSHVRGTISMARANDPNSASSQFFIMHQDNTGLDGKYAAFGTVTDGMDVVDAICEDASNGTLSENPVINSVTILTDK